MVPDYQPRPQLELDNARGRQDDDPPDSAVVVHEQVGERADLTRIEADAPAPQAGEGAAPGAIEAKLTLEEDERRLDGEAVAQHLTGWEGQKAVRAVAEVNFEPEKAAKRLVEHCIHGSAETHSSDDNRSADECARPVERPHSAEKMPHRPRRQTNEQTIAW